MSPALRLAHLRAALPEGTTAFRWLDEGPQGWTVDLFDDVAVLSLYRELDAEAEAALATSLCQAAPLRAVYLKRRPVEAHQGAARVQEVAPPLPLVGGDVPSLVATEASARFEIRPANGLNVGLYLDARDARAWVARAAAGHEVLNLFAYTCGFSIAARRGGAARVVNVDASRKVLDWGRANHALNGLEAPPEDFVCGDVFEWLRRFARQGRRFSLAVVDPPGFSTTRAGRFRAATDYAALLSGLAPLLARGATVLALCNVAKLSPTAFEKQVLEGLAGHRPRVLERFGASPLDFPAVTSSLKCVAVRC